MICVTIYSFQKMILLENFNVDFVNNHYDFTAHALAQKKTSFFHGTTPIYVAQSFVYYTYVYFDKTCKVFGFTKPEVKNIFHVLRIKIKFLVSADNTSFLLLPHCSF